MAQNHFVSCHTCGQMFDTFRGGYYNAGTAQYTCKKCGRSASPALRGVRIGMHQTVVGMVLKLFFGAMFLVVCMSPAEGTEWDLSYFFTCVILGTALILWAVIPWVKARQEQKDLLEQDTKTAAAAEIRRRKAARDAVPKVCPGCGATGTGAVCEYCGTALSAGRSRR